MEITHSVAVPGSHKISLLDQMFWEDWMISLHSMMSCSFLNQEKLYDVSSQSLI